MGKSIQSMSKVQKLTLLAILTALVIVLQLFVIIRLGMFQISVVLIPIVVGAALLGPLAGAWLGFVFGMTVLISGDAALFWAISIPGTVVTVLLKGIAAGAVAGIVYRIIEKKNQLAAIIISAFVCPLTNTGVFVLGCFTFFFKAIESMASDDGKNVLSFVLLVLVGGNFLVELAVNMIFSPIILRLVKAGNKIVGNKMRDL